MQSCSAMGATWLFTKVCSRLVGSNNYRVEPWLLQIVMAFLTSQKGSGYAENVQCRRRMPWYVSVPPAPEGLTTLS
jgi:hypothetical protein